MEVYTQILLQRILTPFATGYVDLQSPAGAGIGAVVYNYDGDVYASDEGRVLAEMGDTTFRLGHVHRDSYEEIFAGLRIAATTTVGLATLAFLAGAGGLGEPLFDGGDGIVFRGNVVFCGLLCVLLAALFDLAFMLVQRMASPWQRVRAA